ncbi:pentatricopeptide repeat-containing protein-like [Dorcoceras hygrometricum]|uniref:Pentatricopeptide repeat-containing protein-like n=1 Tax=Dorcoceras hygrometricum TaxID=472368 RepID=A0A2Z7D881_9LAMI|nr:pentatricopeptide repeat-containing protein-like [Dorcoceras hygrometricum]
MPSFLLTFNYLSSLIPLKSSPSLHSSFLLFRAYTSPAAEKFFTHLEKNQSHVETTLNTVKAKLDYPCITHVLKMCSIDKPQLALRFFVWAGLQSTYRHSSYAYAQACKFLEIEQKPQLVIDVVNAYRAEDCTVSVRMFKVILNLCRAAKDAKLGLWVLRKMKDFDCRPDTVSYNVVIKLVTENGELDEAMGLMREMGLIDLYPDMITYVSIIKGLCDAGRFEDAFALIKVMKGHGCIPNAIVYSTLLDGICMHGSLERALEFLDGMENETGERKPNVVTYTSLIKGFVEKDGLCKEGHVDQAHKVVDKVGVSGMQYAELYSSLVVSLCRAGMFNESENVFRMMIIRGMRPNGLASGSIIERVFSDGRVLDAFGLIDSLEKSGILPPIGSETYSVLLAGLCQGNHLMESTKIASIMVHQRILLKRHHAENITKFLISVGEGGLASRLANANS